MWRFVISLVLAGAGIGSGLSAEQQPDGKSGSVMPVVLEGVLVTKAGAPITGRTVFVFPIDDRGQIIRFMGISADGRMLPIEPDAHAHARTDASGRFRITYAKATAVNLKDDKVLIAGLDNPGLALGVFKRENWRTLRPEDAPFLLVPASGAGAPKMSIRAGSFLVQFGKVMIPQ